MSIAEPPPARAAVRPPEAGLLLIGAGAILLFVSLFLDWYEPGLDAWTAFEVWDLVLALLAIGALAAVAARMGFGPPRPRSWLLAPAVAAFVIVLFAIINHPPAASGLDNDPATGLWLALAAAVLMLAGTVLSVARISVALNVADPPPAAARTPPTEPTRPL
jgi:peptidoglycan/LPS O-acetylase OafA/YrhL